MPSTAAFLEKCLITFIGTELTLYMTKSFKWTNLVMIIKNLIKFNYLLI